MANKEALPLWQTERRVLGYDHSQVGKAVSKDWHLPDEITHGIGFHHIPAEAPASSLRLAATLFVANHCCQEAEIGYCDATLEEENVYQRCIEILAIEADAIDLIMTDIHAFIHEMIEQGLL